MCFLCRVAGLTLRDQSPDIQREIRVEPLLLPIKRNQLRWFGYLIRMPPGHLPLEVLQRGQIQQKRDGNFIEFSSPALPVHYEEEHFLPHTREKRNALLAQVEYTVDVELNVTDVKTVDYLRNLLNNGSFSLALGPTVNVTHIGITTVCYPNGANFQCRCEDQYVWPYRNCITYGTCDEIIDDTCGCINSIPSNGQYCQPKKVPPVVYEYQISIALNTTDADQLRNTLKNIPFPIQISTQINISDADITTVCSQGGTGFQCRCEDDYLWPCDKCAFSSSL
ncbi:uncharacterized protein LOC122863543 [Siniperca chuatsi]|uniref:uncharacterized protein LOC122863543 n=1 Tax=Siniperca chuatsi TaxID=119488 RepID=UPI001CE106A9|nr:uncharacterized protein LOC122863543 [Siniperca chuatsi]